MEYDELRLFEELGINYYSLGAYTNPKVSGDGMRPALTHTPDGWAVEHSPDRDKIPQEFIDHFNLVVIMHIPEWVEKNWHLFNGKRVVWRTIGQSNSLVESRIAFFKNQGMEIIRYSPKERDIPQYAGESAVIRFYKDPEEYKDWNGDIPRVINFTQSLKQRGECCGYTAVMKATEGFNRKIYGPGNDELNDAWGGVLNYEDQKKAFRDNRVFFFHGTAPASYTLSLVEAMMTGIPVVAVGKKYSLNVYGEDTNEIEEIIKNGYNGYVSNDIDELRNRIKMLLEDKNLARAIGEAGRKTAIELFGKDKIKQEWKEFIER